MFSENASCQVDVGKDGYGPGVLVVGGLVGVPAAHVGHPHHLGLRLCQPSGPLHPQQTSSLASIPQEIIQAKKNVQVRSSN